MEDTWCIPHVTTEVEYHKERASEQYFARVRKKELKFKARSNKKYEVKVIIDSAVYGQ